jgi:hypothetical protein
VYNLYLKCSHVYYTLTVLKRLKLVELIKCLLCIANISQLSNDTSFIRMIDELRFLVGALVNILQYIYYYRTIRKAYCWQVLRLFYVVY